MIQIMKLIHYSSKIIESLEERIYDQTKVKWHAKPTGLWVSVEDNEVGYNWKEWCEAEDFNLESLEYAHEIILKEDANIIYIKSPEELFNFTKKYPLTTRNWDAEWDTYQLNWFQVKKLYQGIIISPYQFPCRFALESSWYYGWDCSSGCIWEIKCIKEFKNCSSKLEQAIKAR